MLKYDASFTFACASGTSSAERIQSEYQAAVKAAGSKGSIGIGLLNFCIKPEMLEATIKCKPHSVWLAVGDFKPFIKPLRNAGTQPDMSFQPKPGLRQTYSGPHLRMIIAFKVKYSRADA